MVGKIQVYFLPLVHWFASQLNALMVKRLRRRPLTAESGVRFPMGVPKTCTISCRFLLITSSFLLIHPHVSLHTPCAQLRCPNPRTLGWRFTMWANSLVSLFHDSPWGYQKKTSPVGLVFFIRCLQRHVINACVVCNWSRSVSPMSHCALRARRKLSPNIYWQVVGCHIKFF